MMITLIDGDDDDDVRMMYLLVTDDGGEHGSAYESLYSCADCGKLYMHKRTLKRHELVHSSSSCFTCLVCGKQYSQVPVHLLYTYVITRTSRA